MSLTSLQKPATYLSLLLIGAAGTLLGTNLLPMKGQLVEQPLTQLHAAIPGNANLRLAADSSTNSPLPEKLGGAELLLGLATVAGAAGVIVSARKQNSASHRSSSNPTSNPDIIRIDQASRKLQQKLLMLLHDDQDTANRLLSQVRMRNPRRSIDWYVEKVIYDLERDRGSY